jgi:hypothetical protein
MSEPKPWPDYSFLERAAAEAREASRKYWARGGYADHKWPQQEPEFWPVDAPIEPKPRKRDRRWITQQGK